MAHRRASNPATPDQGVFPARVVELSLLHHDAPLSVYSVGRRLMDMRWVGQDDANGCGVAAAAMLAGRSYADVLALLPQPEAVRSGGGVSLQFTMDQLMTELGFALAKRYPAWMNTYRSEWPPAPWGDRHLCQVYSASGRAHFVVMLRDGTVLDPSTPEPRRLSDYSKVEAVAVVVPIVRTPKPVEGGV